MTSEGKISIVGQPHDQKLGDRGHWRQSLRGNLMGDGDAKETDDGKKQRKENKQKIIFFDVACLRGMKMRFFFLFG